jgi:hypothetical protein
MKSELTEAQKKSSAERKEKMKALVKQIGAMPKADREALAMKVCHVITCEGRGLSLHNQCMIALQSPFATIIGGFQQWRKAGRSVKKGEHGFVIWAPIHPGANADPDMQPPTDEGEKPARPRFILVTMFDVAQTEDIGGVVLDKNVA